MLHYRLEREELEAGPCWFTPSLEEDLGRFIQDVQHMFVVEDLAAVVAEGKKA